MVILVLGVPLFLIAFHIVPGRCPGCWRSWLVPGGTSGPSRVSAAASLSVRLLQAEVLETPQRVECRPARPLASDTPASR